MDGRAFDGAQIGVERLGDWEGEAEARRTRAINAAAPAAPLPAECEADTRPVVLLRNCLLYTSPSPRD